MNYSELVKQLDSIRDKGVTPANQAEFERLQNQLDSEPLTVERFMDNGSVTINKGELVRMYSLYNPMVKHFGVKI